MLRSFTTPLRLRVSLLTWVFVSLVGCIHAGASTPPIIAPICQQAEQDRKLVLLTFINYQSLVSKHLEEKVLPAAPVQEIITKHFRSQRIEPGPTTAELTKHYAITKYPTVLLLRPDGTEIDRLVGYQHPESFAVRLKAIAEGRDELTSLRTAATIKSAGVEPRLALAAALMSRAQYESALPELLWCLESGPMADALGYQRHYRRLFLQTAELGTQIPAARAHLKAFRDQLESVIKPFDVTWAQITFSCNEALKQPGRNLDLYDKLPKTSPLRLRMFPAIFLEMVNSGRYQEAVSVADIEAMITRSLDSSESGTKRLNTQAYDWSIAATEAYIATGDTFKARKLAEQTLTMRNDKLTRAHLRQASLRASSTRSGESGIADLIAENAQSISATK